MDCRVLLDLTATKSIHNGLGQFSIHLGNAILKAKPPWMDIDILIPEDKVFLFPVGCGVRYRHRLMEDRVPSLIKRIISGYYRYDIWHVTNQDSRYWPLDDSTQTVFTIHDLNFLREKKSQKKIQARIHRLQSRVEQASALVTISDFTRLELESTINCNVSQAQVIYNGVAPILAAHTRSAVPSVTKPFLFSIGELLPKKNIKVLLPFLAALENYTLVVAGKNKTTYGQEFKALITEFGLADRVVMLGSISDEQRGWLYQNCNGFLFPSLSEGFGLPLLEAMSYGVPVFCSRQTSLPEIGGKLAFYWDNFSVEHMMEVFLAGMRRANQEQYSVQLQQHAQLFSWEKSALKYIELYARLWNDK